MEEHIRDLRPFRRRELDLDREVRVHYDLNHRRLVVSQGRLVRAHSDRITLVARLNARPAGNRLAREEGRRTVHAFIYGMISPHDFKPKDGLRLKYNPVCGDEWFHEEKTLRTRTSAAWVTLGRYGCWISLEERIPA